MWLYTFASPINAYLWVFQYIPVPIVMKKKNHPDFDSLAPNLSYNLSSIFPFVVQYRTSGINKAAKSQVKQIQSLLLSLTPT